ncbi:hypothetical protein KI387_015542, partial [Taxus chinensis]
AKGITIFKHKMMIKFRLHGWRHAGGLNNLINSKKLIILYVSIFLLCKEVAKMYTGLTAMPASPYKSIFHFGSAWLTVVPSLRTYRIQNLIFFILSLTLENFHQKPPQSPVQVSKLFKIYTVAIYCTNLVILCNAMH